MSTSTTQTASDIDRLRDQLAQYGRKVLEQRLATGAGGNISACAGDTMLISPSGLSLEDTLPEQYVAVSLASGQILDSNALRPSSEVLMHLAIYRKRPEVRAIVHAHPQYTIALTSSGHDLKPMFADAIVYLGQNVPHLEYITVTTPELAAAVEARIGQSNAMVLRNHGAIALGENLKYAFWRACTLEEAAHIQLLATLVGTPVFLDAAEASRLEALSSEQYRRDLIARMVG